MNLLNIARRLEILINDIAIKRYIVSVEVISQIANLLTVLDMFEIMIFDKHLPSLLTAGGWVERQDGILNQSRKIPRKRCIYAVGALLPGMTDKFVKISRFAFPDDRGTS